MIMLTSESNAGQERDREQPSDKIDATQESSEDNGLCTRVCCKIFVQEGQQ